MAKKTKASGAGGSKGKSGVSKGAKAPAKKAAAKSAAKGATKPAAKSSSKPASKPASKTSVLPPPGVTQVSTGSGPKPGAIGVELVAAFNAGRGDEVAQRFWHEHVQSVEGMGMSFNGKKAILAKNQQWLDQHEVLGAAAEGPYVGATGFAIKFLMDVQEKATGKTTRMSEVGVYTVRDGKILSEEFMYGL